MATTEKDGQLVITCDFCTNDTPATVNIPNLYREYNLYLCSRHLQLFELGQLHPTDYAIEIYPERKKIK